MNWLAVGLVCLVMASFALLMFARARARRGVPDVAEVDPALLVLRDEVMARLSLREQVEVSVMGVDSFHVECTQPLRANVARLYFAISETPARREQLVGEYVEGLIGQLRRRR
jgi:hypothetical protein